MNVTNLKKTRDYIAAHPEDYDQSNWMHDCGTPACVAGYAVVACGGTLVPNDRCITSDGVMMRADDHAEELLELTAYQGDRMFISDPFGGQSRSIEMRPTVADALAMLDHAIKHGEVRWPER